MWSAVLELTCSIAIVWKLRYDEFPRRRDYCLQTGNKKEQSKTPARPHLGWLYLLRPHLRRKSKLPLKLEPVLYRYMLHK